ncbi:hypothetical protein CYMTET_56840 [Cymbomonas tetramitiformis]|uniref:Protein kinase domain-containing protein n=1 Tax=Cymbomonas tetramitiformis TaxID=36881 RepID=A0AAE0BBD8_9CHLO|nr:hypothetical protein CYMTET_56840 [Cymbomonas tetramitiformis]
MFGITKKQPLLSQSFWSAVIGLGQETLFLSKVNENAWVLGHAVYANDVCFALVVNIIPFQESDPLEVRSDNPDNLRALMYRAKLSHEQLISYFNAIQAQDRRCPAQGAHVFVLDVDAHTNATGNITFPPSATQERDNEMGISRLALPCDDSTPLKDYLQSVFRCPRLRIFINNKLITSIIYDTSIPGDVAQAVYRHNANKVLALRLWASKGRGTSTQIVPCIIKLYHNNVLICHYTGPSQTWELHGLIDTKDMPGLKVDLRGTGYDTESEFSLRVLISWMDECIENFVKGLSSSPRSAATSATRWIQCCQCLNHRQMQYDVPITLEAYEKWECCHTPGMSCSQPESTKWMPAEKDSNTEIGTSMHFMRTEPTCLEYSAYHFVEGADLIGHGTFANVYTAVNKETGNPVAIKKFLDNLPSGPDQSIGKMLCREVHAQSCVVHDNVCRVHGYIETPPCLVMDLIPSGDTLHEYVCHTNEDTANMEMSNSKMFHCILQIAECIHACHVMGIVHRDIKPSNIMLLHSSVCGGELMCKLIDFGLTSIMNTEAEKKCRQSSYQGQQRGTLPYKDPVALRGKKSADPFSLDVYAFGVTVLELLTRKDAQFEMKEGFDLSELMLIQQNKIDGNHPIVPRTQVPEHWRILINDCWKSKNRPDMADILLRLRYNEDFQQLDAQLDNHEMDICQAASPGSNAIQDVPIQRSVSVEEGECTDALPSPHAIAHLPGRGTTQNHHFSVTAVLDNTPQINGPGMAVDACTAERDQQPRDRPRHGPVGSCIKKHGTVKKQVHNGAYFITPQDGGAELFCPRKNVVRGNDLHPGDEVEYTSQEKGEKDNCDIACDVSVSKISGRLHSREGSAAQWEERPRKIRRPSDHPRFDYLRKSPSDTRCGRLFNVMNHSHGSVKLEVPLLFNNTSYTCLTFNWRKFHVPRPFWPVWHTLEGKRVELEPAKGCRIGSRGDCIFEGEVYLAKA